VTSAFETFTGVDFPTPGIFALWPPMNRIETADYQRAEAMFGESLAIFRRLGYGAITMKDRLAQAMKALPEPLRRSVTWDRGKELSAHAQFTAETGIPVFFAVPHSPWQRGTNENTNGLLRQYFPKGTDLSRWTNEDLRAVAAAINNRPRKCLGWKMTPAGAIEEQIRSLQQPGGATIG
jgi:IS30 family transposase